MSTEFNGSSTNRVQPVDISPWLWLASGGDSLWLWLGQGGVMWSQNSFDMVVWIFIFHHSRGACRNHNPSVGVLFSFIYFIEMNEVCFMMSWREKLQREFRGCAVVFPFLTFCDFILLIYDTKSFEICQLKLQWLSDFSLLKDKVIFCGTTG